ncbi:hypothetical protein AMTR_s00028p00068090 [Amborella trichopoda]|uniref:Uncharacterized protein n=1 Tax=Amborella trichopoda TaxID=13333 RepID=W1PRU4_AMBTC|nr:hypothetical protein AMTR_s00028p00068090 [Amborella trichopoda]
MKDTNEGTQSPSLEIDWKSLKASCSLALEHTLHPLLPLKDAVEAETGGLKTIFWPLVACAGSPPACSSAKVINASWRVISYAPIKASPIATYMNPEKEEKS